MANAAEAFRIKGELYGVVDDTARETASAATVLEEFDRQKGIGQYPGRSLADAFAAEIAAKGDIYAWLHSRVQDADFSGLRIGDYMDVPVAAGSNVPAQTVRYLLAAVDPYYQCSDSPMPHHLAFVPAAPVLVSGARPPTQAISCGHHGHQQRETPPSKNPTLPATFTVGRSTTICQPFRRRFATCLSTTVRCVNSATALLR